ncbi:hypothetical protein QTG56_23945 (plasmid) [Rossellomorea sp. AcN35-11]|nr:hypothetical protein [Rossellomorea aquimaris]WJV31691.1 hypothetical protein QTG56_23945 [Rossellomorea sp. AcN35-11]
MTKFIGGTEKVPLTEGLLNLIIMVQDHKEFLLSKSQFENSHFSKSKVDWHKETMEFFNSLDNEVLEKYGLSKNLLSYEKVIHFKVTPEMRATTFSKLPETFTF